MKRWIASLTLLLLILPMAVSYGQTPTAWGRFTWKYDTSGRDGIPGNADDDPFCTAAEPMGCLSGFRIFKVTSTGTETVWIDLVPTTNCALVSGSTSLYACQADAPLPGTGKQRYDPVTSVYRAIMIDSAGVERLTDPSNPVQVGRKARPPHDAAVS